MFETKRTTAPALLAVGFLLITIAIAAGFALATEKPVMGAEQEQLPSKQVLTLGAADGHWCDPRAD